MTVMVKGGNNPPTKDGDLNRYISHEVDCKSWFDTSREIVFVNGMDNSPTNHVESAVNLSLIQGCPVVGVFNKSDGFAGDVFQCLRDKGVLVPVQAGNFDAWSAAFDSLYGLARLTDATLSKIDFMERTISGNAATASLYRYVAHQPTAKRAKMKIFCHSQGNLITSNALTAVALACGEEAISGLEVNSYGSPCRFWPPGLNRTNNAYTFDLVSMLDYNIGFDSVKVGLTPGLFAHGFDTYMSQDAEFIVNRFRWGSLRMTASMDEKGLATYLTKIGNNPPRLTKIFAWLDDKHNSDADDVAMHYTKKMRTTQPGLMQTIANADNDLIKLLIRCMKEGVTFSDEKTEIDYLKSLI